MGGFTQPTNLALGFTSSGQTHQTGQIEAKLSADKGASIRNAEFPRLPPTPQQPTDLPPPNTAPWRQGTLRNDIRDKSGLMNRAITACPEGRDGGLRTPKGHAATWVLTVLPAYTARKALCLNGNRTQRMLRWAERNQGSPPPATRQTDSLLTSEGVGRLLHHPFKPKGRRV